MERIHFIVQAVLSEFAGNHERELTAWVFGTEAEYMLGGYVRRERPHADDMAWAWSEDQEGTLDLVPHDEYGLVWQIIGDDPDWIKKSIEAGQQPRYGRMVQWKLVEEPTSEQWNTLVDVLKSYSDSVTFESIKLKRIVTSEQIIRETPDSKIDPKAAMHYLMIHNRQEA